MFLVWKYSHGFRKLLEWEEDMELGKGMKQHVLDCLAYAYILALLYVELRTCAFEEGNLGTFIRSLCDAALLGFMLLQIAFWWIFLAFCCVLMSLLAILACRYVEWDAGAREKDNICSSIKSCWSPEAEGNCPVMSIIKLEVFNAAKWMVKL